jgi:hypothetical protein
MRGLSGNACMNSWPRRFGEATSVYKLRRSTTSAESFKTCGQYRITKPSATSIRRSRRPA